MLLTLYDTNDGRIVHNVSLEMLDAAFLSLLHVLKSNAISPTGLWLMLNLMKPKNSGQ